MPAGGTYCRGRIPLFPASSASRSLLYCCYTWVHCASSEHSVLANHMPGSSKAKRRTLGLYWTQAWVWSLQKMRKGIQGLLPGNHRKGNLAPCQLPG